MELARDTRIKLFNTLSGIYGQFSKDLEAQLAEQSKKVEEERNALQATINELRAQLAKNKSSQDADENPSTPSDGDALRRENGEVKNPNAQLSTEIDRLNAKLSTAVQPAEVPARVEYKSTAIQTDSNEVTEMDGIREELQMLKERHKIQGQERDAYKEAYKRILEDHRRSKENARRWANYVESLEKSRGQAGRLEQRISRPSSSEHGSKEEAPPNLQSHFQRPKTTAAQRTVGPKREPAFHPRKVAPKIKEEEEEGMVLPALEKSGPLSNVDDCASRKTPKLRRVKSEPNSEPQIMGYNWHNDTLDLDEVGSPIRNRLLRTPKAAAKIPPIPPVRSRKPPVINSTDGEDTDLDETSNDCTPVKPKSEKDLNFEPIPTSALPLPQRQGLQGDSANPPSSPPQLTRTPRNPPQRRNLPKSSINRSRKPEDNAAYFIFEDGEGDKHPMEKLQPTKSSEEIKVLSELLNTSPDKPLRSLERPTPQALGPIMKQLKASRQSEQFPELAAKTSLFKQLSPKQSAKRSDMAPCSSRKTSVKRKRDSDIGMMPSPSDFRINPEKNNGVEYAYSEVVRGERRKCLPSCTKPCCRQLSAFVAAAGVPKLPKSRAPRFRSPTPTSSLDRIPPEEGTEKAFTERYGRHREIFAPGDSPAGFWRSEFPDSDDLEEDLRENERRKRKRAEERQREAERSGLFMRR